MIPDKDISKNIRKIKSVSKIQEPKIKLPKGWNDPIIVLGYNGEIRLMCVMDKKVVDKWTRKDTEKLRKMKIKWLEKYLGYKIIKMSKLVSHKFYESYAKEHKK